MLENSSIGHDIEQLAKASRFLEMLEDVANHRDVILSDPAECWATIRRVADTAQGLIQQGIGGKA